MSSWERNNLIYFKINIWAAGAECKLRTFVGLREVQGAGRVSREAESEESNIFP